MASGPPCLDRMRTESAKMISSIPSPGPLKSSSECNRSSPTTEEGQFKAIDVEGSGFITLVQIERAAWLPRKALILHQNLLFASVQFVQTQKHMHQNGELISLVLGFETWGSSSLESLTVNFPWKYYLIYYMDVRRSRTCLRAPCRRMGSDRSCTYSISAHSFPNQFFSC